MTKLIPVYDGRTLLGSIKPLPNRHVVTTAADGKRLGNLKIRRKRCARSGCTQECARCQDEFFPSRYCESPRWRCCWRPGARARS